MALEIVVVYLALAALFYLRLTVTATDAAVKAHIRHSHWQRVRSIKKQALRRFRPLLALRVPKRTR